MEALPPEGRDFLEVIEGFTLRTICHVYGDPIPFLKCYLLDKNGNVDNGQITSNDKRNFTFARPLRFHNVRRTVTKIECEMDGGYYSGKTKHWRKVVVACKCPFRLHSIVYRNSIWLTQI